jgi:hypothetical protein
MVAKGLRQTVPQSGVRELGWDLGPKASEAL